jgi:hypothetical protein
MGKVSREARLLFVNMWTLADDEGRLRAASRMLASLLYPYDDDAPDLIEGWLGELERVRSIHRYVVDDTTYAQVTNWLEHQKIDRASKSRLPAPGEPSRQFASPREVSPPYLGPRTLDQDLGKSADACARDPRLKAVGERVLALCGDSPNLLHYARVETWLGSGADPELDIFPTITAVVAKLGKAPSSLNYFDGPIADAVARRTKPMPTGDPFEPPAFLDRRPKSRAQEQADAAAVVFGAVNQRVNGPGNQPSPARNPRLLPAAIGSKDA